MSPGGTPLSVNRSAASTPDEIAVPTTVTTRPETRAPVDAASSGEPARTLPVMTAEVPDVEVVVDGVVGEFVAPQADSAIAAVAMTVASRTALCLLLNM